MSYWLGQITGIVNETFYFLSCIFLKQNAIPFLHFAQWNLGESKSSLFASIVNLDFINLLVLGELLEDLGLSKLNNFFGGSITNY